MELQLNGDQVSELHKLIKDTLGELSSEIADTDNAAFRRTLRERRNRLESIDKQLESERARQ